MDQGKEKHCAQEWVVRQWSQALAANSLRMNPQWNRWMSQSPLCVRVVADWSCHRQFLVPPSRIRSFVN
jgi:hypothetical protein